MIHLDLEDTSYESDIRELTMAFFPPREAEDKEITVRLLVRRENPPGEETAAAPSKVGEAVGAEEVSLERAPEGGRHTAFHGPAAVRFEAAADGEDPRTSQEITVEDYGDRFQAKSAIKRLLYDTLSAMTGKRLPWGTLTGIRPTKIAMGLLKDGMGGEDAAALMEREYYTSPEKAALCADIAAREMEILRPLDCERGYSLYVGIPFCPTTCLYCSFTSYPIGLWRDRMDEYLGALCREMDYVAGKMAGRPLDTVYFGGGTPTSLDAGDLDRLLCHLEKMFPMDRVLELTVEAGRPDSITAEKLKVLKSHGVTRISINPQTMNQKTLDLIGRRHTVEMVEESFHMARDLGFDNINMDLILGLPEETTDDVAKTMERVRALAPDSLTVHSLAIKRAARLNMFKEQYGALRIVNTQEMIDLTAACAKDMGLAPYYMYRQKNMAGNFENVGYAAPGKACIYNILIMEERQTIAACGAGTTTKVLYPAENRLERAENVKNVEQYIGRLEEMLERKERLL